MPNTPRLSPDTVPSKFVHHYTGGLTTVSVLIVARDNNDGWRGAWANTEPDSSCSSPEPGLCSSGWRTAAAAQFALAKRFGFAPKDIPIYRSSGGWYPNRWMNCISRAIAAQIKPVA